MRNSVSVFELSGAHCQEFEKFVGDCLGVCFAAMVEIDDWYKRLK